MLRGITSAINIVNFIPVESMPKRLLWNELVKESEFSCNYKVITKRWVKFDNSWEVDDKDRDENWYEIGDTWVVLTRVMNEETGLYDYIIETYLWSMIPSGKSVWAPLKRDHYDFSEMLEELMKCFK